MLRLVARRQPVDKQRALKQPNTSAEPVHVCTKEINISKFLPANFIADDLACLPSSATAWGAD
eukprot:11972919-Alexandrium_andersonii.AAC.1